MRFLFALFVIIQWAHLKSQPNLGFTIAPDKKKVQIPIEIHNNLVVVPVVLNNQLPLKFILDTGVRTAILTDKAFSDILRLPYLRKYVIATPGAQKSIEAYVASGVTIDLPGVKGIGHAMLVLEEDFLELRNYMGVDVHGVLGYELFSRFITQIDYDKKQLTLYAHNKFRKPRKFKPVPIKIEDTKPYVYTTVKQADGTEVEVKLLIDSGASHGLMLDVQTDERLIVPERNVESILGRGLGGVIIGQIGRIKGLTLGNYFLEDVITNFPGPDAYMDSIKYTLSFRNGSIGGEVLNRFNVIYNFPGEEMYLKRGNSFGKNFYYNMGGLTLKAKGSRLNRFEVTDVRKDSSADKGGVKTGDILIKINNISAEDLTLHQLNGFFNSQPGRKITLEIERDGKRLKKEFRLESPI